MQNEICEYCFYNQIVSKSYDSNESVISNTIKPVGNRMGFERVYIYENNYYIIIGVGTNGFIVSAYPHKKGGK